jgi:hypothetical protein
MELVTVWPALGLSVPKGYNLGYYSPSGETVPKTSLVTRQLASGDLLLEDPSENPPDPIFLEPGPVYATAFGAVGDDSADDTAAIQKAIDATAPGGALFVPPGIYRITSALLRTESIYIYGTGTLKRAGTAWALDGSGHAQGVLQLLQIHGASANSKIPMAWIDGITIDGADAGAVVYNSGSDSGNNQCDDLKIFYVDSVRVESCRFLNPRRRSLALSSNTSALVTNTHFRDGPLSNGSNDPKTAYHIGAFSNTYVTIDGGCTFQTDLTYVPGDKSQAGQMGAPIAVVATNNEHIVCDHIISRNAGNLEIYEANTHVTVDSCQFLDCHMPPIKISNTQYPNVINNTIVNPKPYWGSAILVSCYTRIDTYGCLRPDQGIGVIMGNTLKGCRGFNGAIHVRGEAYSTAVLDTRIAYQTAHGEPSTNRVDKIGSDYKYTDFDGTQYGVMDQKYMLARSMRISTNPINGFAVAGVYATYCDRVRSSGHVMLNACTLDASFGYTKACIKFEECLDARSVDDTASCPEGTIPTALGVAQAMNGIMCTASGASFKGITRFHVSNFETEITKVNCVVYIESLGRFTSHNNQLGVIDFDTTSSSWLRAASPAGRTKRGKISGTSRYLKNTGVAPTPATEFLLLQKGFLSLDFQDEHQGSELSRRMIDVDADFTGKAQSVAASYTLGSIVQLKDNTNKTYRRCETAGHYAPDYSAGATYAIGDIVKSAGGNFFEALQTISVAGSHTPPVTGVSDSWWSYLGGTEAAFTSYSL